MQLKYTNALYYYEGQSPDGKKLQKETYYEEQLVRMNERSLPPELLATSDAMKHYLTKELQEPSKEFEEELATLDQSKLYNVLSFNMNTTMNGTYLLQISAYQDVYTSYLTAQEKNVTFNFHFQILDCNPKKYNQGFTNSSKVTYFHNNGTEITSIDFFNNLTFTPSCDGYVNVFEINYSEIQLYNSTLDKFIKVSPSMQKILEMSVKANYENPEFGELKVKIDSTDNLGLYFIPGLLRPFNIKNPGLYKQFSAVEPIGFYLNATIEIFKVNTPPTLIEIEDDGGFELTRTFSATNTSILEPYTLPPIKN
jgi:hypothetical protein